MENKENGVTIRQDMFAKHYATYGVGVHAYLSAFEGVSYEVAKTEASKLLTNPHIKDLVQRYKADLAVKFDVTKEKMVRDLTETAELAKENKQFIAYAKMKDQIIKMFGFYAPDKIEQTTNQTITVIKTIEVKPTAYVTATEIVPPHLDKPGSE